MEKNIYILLNNGEIDLKGYQKEELNEVEKRKIIKSFKNSERHNTTLKKAASIIAIVVVISISFFGVSLGVYAYESANLILKNIASYLHIEKNLEVYTTVVNQQVTKGGITVSLNEVILDKDELVVSTIATCNEKAKDSFGFIFNGGMVYINGKHINSAGSGGGVKQIDDNTSEAVISFNLNGKNLSGDLDIKIVFDSIVINDTKKHGPWVFKFKTNGDELSKNTIEIPLNNSFTLENGQIITLYSYTNNALGQKIYYSKDTKGTTYDVVLRGYDDLGNNVEFYGSWENESNGVFKFSNIGGNLAENVKILSLTPFAVEYPKGNGKMSNDYKKVGKEFTIILTR